MKFSSLTLKPWLYKALSVNNFIDLTEVQEKTFKAINQGKNVVVSAPTGSGKTLCYLLPMLNNIKAKEPNIQYLIVAPTKELVWQIYHNLLSLTKFNSALKIVLLDNNDKVENLKHNPSQIVIGTVEKIAKAISIGVNFKYLKQIVLDEADMLIDYGFVGSINALFDKLNLYRNDIQKTFFSASIHNTVANTFKKAVGNIVSIQLEKNIFTNNKIEHSIVYQKNNDKPIETLKALLKIINPYVCIIFANTKKEVENIYAMMLNAHMDVAMLHKDLNPRERKQVFNRVKNNEFKYLVATDLASRGLDIDGVSDVISFGLPKEDIWYLHRAGRTGRGKYNGSSYVIYDKQYSNNINHLAKKINWVYYMINGSYLVEKAIKIKSKPAIMDVEMKKEISKLYTSKATKVKPGYKKKIKKQIFKMQQAKKHEYLERKYKQMRIEKYKEQNRRRGR